jgi:hypothetical protein
MKSKPHRQGDRQIDFLKCRVVIFLLSFFVKGGLLNFINCNPDVLGMCWPTGEALASDGRAVSAWLESLVVAWQLASLYLWLSQ